MGREEVLGAGRTGRDGLGTEGRIEGKRIEGEGKRIEPGREGGKGGFERAGQGRCWQGITEHRA